MVLALGGLVACEPAPDATGDRATDTAAAAVAPDTTTAGSGSADTAATSYAYLEDEAERIIGFLQGATDLDSGLVADTVTFHVAPDGGGARARASGRALMDRRAWRVGDYSLVPPPTLTELTTRPGRHINCFEAPLQVQFPELAGRPHIGVKLEGTGPSTCLRTWNITLVFDDDRAAPRLTDVVYDQWEW